MPLDLAIRQTGIGASEAAAALGVDPWKSRFALWCEKVGDLAPADLSDVECIKRGNRLEPVVVDAYGEESGREVVYNHRQTTRRSDRYPFMLATLDSTQYKRPVSIPSNPGALEIKTTNAYAAEDWKDAPPLRVQVQLQHQLAVTGLAWGSVAALIGGQKLVWYDIDRHDAFIDAMIEKEAAFWNSVEKRIQPPVDGSDATAAAVRALYQTSNGEAVDLPAEAADWDIELVACKARIKAEKVIEKELATKIKAAIGEASFGVLPSGERYRWQDQDRAGYTVEAGTTKPLVRMKK